MKNKKKLIPFGCFFMSGFELDVMLLCVPGENSGIAKMELPDKIFGFKSCSISYPNLVIEKREGFTDFEMSEIINIMRDNMSFIQEVSILGGYNA